MFRIIYSKWRGRKRYKTFGELPDWLVACLALSGFLMSGYNGYVLSEVIHDYLNTAESIPFSSWGVKGWLLTAIVAVLGLIVWLFGSLSWRCNGILRDRWFK